GFRSWMAHDDLFFLNPKWMLEFCDRYQAAGLDQPFICQMRADMICRFEHVVQRMAEAGLAWAMIGFESGSQRILDLFEKGTTVEQNLRAAEICRRHGVKVWANIMFGAPSETKAEAAMERVALVNTPSLRKRAVSRGMAGGLGFDGAETLVLPPLDLALMAATLRGAGFAVELIDADPLGLDDARVYERLDGTSYAA